MTESLQRWLEDSEQNRRLFAEEGLILDATEAIIEAMSQKQVSKAELAAALGKSKAYVTQLLNGSRNMTLRTLADIAFALGLTPAIELSEPLGYGHWKDVGSFAIVRVPRKFFASANFEIVDKDEWSDVIPLRAQAA